MNEHLKSLLLDGIEGKRKTLSNRTKTLLSQKYALLLDGEVYYKDLDQFIEQLNLELSNIKKELIELNRVEREANEV